MSGESKGQQIKGGAAEQLASGPELARWLGISGKAVYELAKAGILVRVSRDQFSLEETVRRYCEHLRQAVSQRGATVPEKTYHDVLPPDD